MTPDDATETTDDARDSDVTADGGLSRRTLIRLLVGLGIGIPVAIELATFLGLVGDVLTGGGDGGGEDGADDGDGSTGSDGDAAVGVGDELLPETAPAETLVGAQLRTDGDAFVLALTVTVENSTDDPYRFRFGSVTTDGGRTREGGGNEIRVAPGETRSVADRWELPPGSTPRTLTVYTARGDASETSRTARLARIPVQGG